MKKKCVVILLVVSMLTGCSLKKDYISQNFKITEYRDYLIASEMSESLNYLVNNNDSETSVYANFVDGLVENDNYGRIVNSLSQTTGQIDDNYSRWTFHLREGLFWMNYNGDSTEYPIIADDFVFAVEYILDPANNSKYVSLITSIIAGAKEYYVAKLNGQSPDFSTVGVKAVGNYAIEYTLTSSNLYFNSYLTSAAFYPLSRAFYYSLEEGSFATSVENILYNGCYYLTSVTDSKINLEKNNSYWEEEKVTFEKLVYQIVDDEEEAAKLFKNGNLSTVHVSSDVAKSVFKDYTNYMYASSLDKTSYVLLSNFESDNSNFKLAINNLNFRKALQYGFDRSLIMPVTETSHLNSSSSLIPQYYVVNSKNVDYTNFGSVNDLEKPSLYNEAEAIKYLEKAKEELGNTVFPITIRVPISSKSEQELALIKNLNTAYSKVFGNSTIEFVATEYTNAESIADGVTLTNSYDMILVGIDVDARDPYEYLKNFEQTGYLNTLYTHINNDLFFSFLNEANSYTIMDNRYRALNECEAILVKEGLVIPYSLGVVKYALSMVNDYSKPIGYYGIAYKKVKGYEVIARSISLDELKSYYEKYLAAAKEL